MLLKVLSFGCNWWARFGPDPSDPYRYTRHAAYFNSAGIRCGNKVRRHWIVPGLVRFNGAGGFNPHLPSRVLGRNFVSSELEQRFGGNRLLLKGLSSKSASPDWYLVAVSSELHGRMDFKSAALKSATAQVISASQLRDRQEAMLLMKPFDWVRTGCGTWQLIASESGFCAELQLVGEQVLA